MCLVAQFGKWLGRIIFLRANVFDVNIKQKRYCRVARVLMNLSRGLLFIFKELQKVTDTYLANSRGFLIARASIIEQSNWNCADFCKQT